MSRAELKVLRPCGEADKAQRDAGRGLLEGAKLGRRCLEDVDQGLGRKGERADGGGVWGGSGVRALELRPGPRVDAQARGTPPQTAAGPPQDCLSVCVERRGNTCESGAFTWLALPLLGRAAARAVWGLCWAFGGPRHTLSLQPSWSTAGISAAVQASLSLEPAAVLTGQDLPSACSPLCGAGAAPGCARAPPGQGEKTGAVTHCCLHRSRSQAGLTGGCSITRRVEHLI